MLNTVALTIVVVTGLHLMVLATTSLVAPGIVTRFLKGTRHLRDSPLQELALHLAVSGAYCCAHRSYRFREPSCCLRGEIRRSAFHNHPNRLGTTRRPD